VVRVRPGSIWEAARETVRDFVDDEAMILGAALAYYTALSLAPLVVLLLWFASFLGDGMQQQLVAQIQDVVGPQAGAAISGVIDNAKAQPSVGNIAGIVSLATLLFSVSGVFAQLQYALNRIWDVEASPAKSGAWAWVRKRLLSIGTFVSVAFLLVVSMAVTAAVAALSQFARGLLPGADVVWYAAAWLVSFALTALMFALVYKVLPDVTIGWREALIGAVGTALLFAAGRWAIGLYLGRSAVGSAYGAAGSLIVLLIWVYYASLILFAGAELTQVVARRLGRQIEPDAHAIRIRYKREPEVARRAQ
jgi:membrane protein